MSGIVPTDEQIDYALSVLGTKQYMTPREWMEACRLSDEHGVSIPSATFLVMAKLLHDAGVVHATKVLDHINAYTLPGEKRP